MKTWLTVLLSLGGIFDVDQKERRLEEVNQEMENPDLWNDPEHAQKVSKEKKMLDDLVGSFTRLTSGITDAKELFDMSLAEEDEAGAEAIAAEVDGYAKDVEKLEFKRMFNQPMDSANCYIEYGSDRLAGRVGGLPYPDLPAAQADPQLAALTCPYCGQPLTLGEWTRKDGNTMLAYARCNEGDEYLAVCRYGRTPEGIRMGRMVYEMSDDLWDVYQRCIERQA